MTKKHKMTIMCALLAAALLGLLLATLPVSNTYAELPRRSTPGPVVEDVGNKPDSIPPGAYIRLQADVVPAGAWAGVEWQDTAENWHAVEGWQDALGADGVQEYWVAPKDFSTGPFRWVIRAGQDGPVTASSQSFYLPNHVNETLVVTLSPAD